MSIEYTGEPFEVSTKEEPKTEQGLSFIPKNHIMIFDTETNGKIINYSLSCENVDNYPRLSQLSYKIYDEKFELIKTVNNFVTPDGWEFPDEPFFKENADINKNIEFGKPVAEVLKEFIDDRLSCEYVAGHNISFDSKIIRAEMFRLGIQLEFTAKKICTMKQSTQYCKIPYPSGKKGAKFPSLTELHTFLFGTPFEGAHDSSGDVDATAKCLFQLINLKVITLD